MQALRIVCPLIFIITIHQHQKCQSGQTFPEFLLFDKFKFIVLLALVYHKNHS